MAIFQPKNMAEFKRRLQVGVRFHGVHHQDCPTRDPVTGRLQFQDRELGIRPVHRRQTNAWTALITDGPNAGKESWMYFHRSRDWTFSPDGATYYTTDRQTGERIKCLTYRLVEEPDGTPQSA